MNRIAKLAASAVCFAALTGCGGKVRTTGLYIPPVTPAPSSTDSGADNGRFATRAPVNTNSQPIPPPPPSAPDPDPSLNAGTDTSRSGGMMFDPSQLKDVYFDYNRSQVSATNVPVLTQDVEALKRFEGAVTIEGHADERGSAEYNLALADRRAAAVKEYLIDRGIAANRLYTVSYGKERPQCTQQNEACWSRNRRAHFAGAQ